MLTIRVAAASEIEKEGDDEFIPYYKLLSTKFEAERGKNRNIKPKNKF